MLTSCQLLDKTCQTFSKEKTPKITEICRPIVRTPGTLIQAQISK